MAEYNKWLLECLKLRTKNGKLKRENKKLKAMLKSISDVSMGKIKFDIDELLSKYS